MLTQNTLSKPNPSRKLSSIEFRRYVNSIDTLEKLIDSKEYLARYIKSKFQIKEYVDQFLEELEPMLKYQEHGHDIGYIKIWILTYTTLLLMAVTLMIQKGPYMSSYNPIIRI